MKAKAKAADGYGWVRLALTHPTAREVYIAGSFNDWHPTVTPMHRVEDGSWVKELALPPGRYEYRFVVDGQWVDDPAATEVISNSFGASNAVLVIEAPKPIATVGSSPDKGLGSDRQRHRSGDRHAQGRSP